MFTHCPTCHRDLGRNRILEPFPVGRRLAFDPEKGRLWALCERCRGWHLAPIDERWEAVEEAERVFERTTIGASTEHVTLARADDGTRLLRVGKAKPGELAAWRYGERVRNRSRVFVRRLLGWGFGGGLGYVGAVTLVPALAGIPATVLLLGGVAAHTALDPRGTRLLSPGLRVGGERVPGWRLRYLRLLPAWEAPGGWRLEVDRGGRPAATLAGPDALRALRGVLPVLNSWGVAPRTVDNAVAEVVRLGSADEVMRAAADELAGPDAWQPLGRPPSIQLGKKPRHRLSGAHPALRLAVEMAANDEVERRALEGELALLEREWREAEELASISDRLLLPESIRVRLREMRERVGGPRGGDEDR